MSNAAYLLTTAGSAGRVWTPCPRTYAGNMCGIYVPNLPFVPGGSSNTSLVVSWFLDRYSEANQARILDAYRQRGLTDILVSWPDSRAIGKSPQQFADWCSNLYQRGFEPAVMLCSKNYDPPDIPDLIRNIGAVLPLLKRRVGRICVGWELSLWLTPADVQQLIDWLAPQIVPWGGRLYVHFQTGYASFDYDGPNASFAGFWNRNIGKLTGLFYQGDVNWTPDYLQAKIKDSLDRFAGGYNCSPTSGLGHPWDDIALETQADKVFNQNTSEAVQNVYARASVTTEPAVGPFGPVVCMGAGNGVA